MLLPLCGRLPLRGRRETRRKVTTRTTAPAFGHVPPLCPKRAGRGYDAEARSRWMTASKEAGTAPGVENRSARKRLLVAEASSLSGRIASTDSVITP